MTQIKAARISRACRQALLRRVQSHSCLPDPAHAHDLLQVPSMQQPRKQPLVALSSSWIVLHLPS